MLHPLTVFRVTVYLLGRAYNLLIKQVAAFGKVSVPPISQIQRQIEDSGGLGDAFQWARKFCQEKIPIHPKKLSFFAG
ncbi:MAG: hypothetical protein ACE5I5_19345 [Candidatus Heimdallarchaeota archaeon]